MAWARRARRSIRPTRPRSWTTSAVRAFRDRFNIPIADDKLADGNVPFYPPGRELAGSAIPARAPRRWAATCRSAAARPPVARGAGAGGVRAPAEVQRRARDQHHHGLRADVQHHPARQAGRPARACRSWPTRPAPSAWKACSARSASTRRRARSTSRWIADQLMYYREDAAGQVLEEGITEAGAFSSAGWRLATSYSTNDLQMLPFYIYYSMFGFQRIGDSAWQAGDMRARGFLLGGTAGTHHAQRRRPAARGRPEPPAGRRDSPTAAATTRPSPTKWR
jgi:pyruvate dehydrogenase E1 component